MDKKIGDIPEHILKKIFSQANGDPMLAMYGCWLWLKEENCVLNVTGVRIRL